MRIAVLRNTGLATFGVLMQGLARFLYTIVIGRALGVETLGRVSALLALGVFVSLFWPAGAGVAASRFIPRDTARGFTRSPSARVLTRSFLLSLPILSVGTFFVALVISGDAWSALSAVLLMASYSAYAYTRGAGLGAGRFGKIAVLDTVSSAVSLGLLAAVLLGHVGWAALLPLTLGYAVFAGVCWPRTGTDPVADKGELHRFVAVNSIAQVATGGLLQVAMLVSLVFDTPLQAGLFAAAFSLATPASMIGLSINQVLIPHFAGLAARASADVRGSWLRVTGVTAGGLAVIFGMLILLAPTVIQIFYGTAYTGAVDYMRWLLLLVYIYSVSLIPAAALIATGRDRPYTFAVSLGFVVGAAVMFALGAVLGAWAAVVGYGIATVLSASVVVWLGMKRSVPAPSVGASPGSASGSLER